MVNGPRRRPSNYSLNIQHHEYSIAELRRARKYRRFSVVLRVIYEDNPSERTASYINYHVLTRCT